ncbi:MAG: hypothetical protein ACTHMJ_10310 [Thermomicrobiales bacterium]
MTYEARVGDDQPLELITALKHGRISRREFLVRAAALGFSGAAISAFLIAWGGNSAGDVGPAVGFPQIHSITAAPPA